MYKKWQICIWNVDEDDVDKAGFLLSLMFVAAALRKQLTI